MKLYIRSDNYGDINTPRKPRIQKPNITVSQDEVASAIQDIVDNVIDSIPGFDFLKGAVVVCKFSRFGKQFTKDASVSIYLDLSSCIDADSHFTQNYSASDDLYLVDYSIIIPHNLLYSSVDELVSYIAPTVKSKVEAELTSDFLSSDTIEKLIELREKFLEDVSDILHQYSEEVDSIELDDDIYNFPYRSNGKLEDGCSFYTKINFNRNLKNDLPRSSKKLAYIAIYNDIAKVEARFKNALDAIVSSIEDYKRVSSEPTDDVITSEIDEWVNKELMPILQKSYPDYDIEVYQSDNFYYLEVLRDDKNTYGGNPIKLKLIDIEQYRKCRKFPSIEYTLSRLQKSFYYRKRNYGYES